VLGEAGVAECVRAMYLESVSLPGVLDPAALPSGVY